MTNLSDRTVALLRTVVPVLWGSLLAAILVHLPLPAEVAAYLVSLSELVTIAAIAGWYAIVRWLEPRLPRWARALLIGAPAEPSYEPVAGAQQD